jgi:hypothetical protein
MRFREFAPVAAMAAALSVTAVTTGSADTCYAPTALCALFAANEPEPTPPAEAQAEAPLKPESAARKPVAASAPRAIKAPRALKKREARASHAKAKHHSNRRLAEVQAKPAVVRTDATEAYAFDTAALVRVVGPDELNEIDRAVAPGDESRFAYAAEPTPGPAQVDSVDQVDARLAVSLDMLARKLAAMPRPQPQVQVQAQPEPQPEPETWLQWALSRLTRVYASASAAVRTLLG